MNQDAFESEHNKDGSMPDDRYGQLFSKLDGDAAPVDAEFLKQLEDQTTEQLGSSSDANVASEKGSTMSAIVTRFTLLAAAASLLLGLFAFNNSNPKKVSLADALQQTANATSLHFRVKTAESTRDIWANTKVGLVRIDQGDGKYSISNASRSWNVDQSENRVTTGDAKLFDADSRLRLLSLFENLPTKLTKQLDKVFPDETITREGKSYFVYHVTDDESAGKAKRLLTVEVDAQLKLLHSIQWGTGANNSRVELVAANAPVDDGLFIVDDTLTSDGRLGKISEVQGLVVLRPMFRRRWTVVVGQRLLKTGDWVRTDQRGANAVGFELVNGARLVLGPGSLVEFVSSKELKLVRGEMQIEVDDDSSLTVLGPASTKRIVKKETFLRVSEDGKIAPAEKPRWLAGFIDAKTSDSVGSLVTKIGEEDVSLSVGFHRVTVDIRDQIARTVIEESFVNHTDEVLEGVFYFPLPQDASISGFGMWINGELVEADVVEKQRAREIYETILREKRDPGLLEWSGGNLFKARVYPIQANSEKKIKISYTQVLPMKGSEYRYSYGLQSDMLQENPLRELDIQVRVSSSRQIRSVSSPTHDGSRIQKTKNAAQVDFNAQSYTPTRDFEVVVDVETTADPALVISHRRGENGYMMVQITPPGEQAAGWKSDLVDDGDPVKLLVLCDTSASMDPQSRAQQAEFIGAVLSSLDNDDQFNLATVDVECDWKFEKSVRATGKNVTAARAYLGRRQSLGWSDLENAFGSVMQRCDNATHVIYVGDGVATTSAKDDPAALSTSLKLLYSKRKKGTFHAVSVSSLFDSTVLKAIGSLGSGSVRRVADRQDVYAVAKQLLKEITKPGLRDLKVEFSGIRVAKVYPEKLPNLAPGTQQVIMARYLPEGDDQSGELVVTGKLGRKNVSYRIPISIKAADEGNSFIPRLWARQHLDHLLEQGSGPEIRDEIIQLSERFHLMTPYTSLLVLESDADRERFKVKRRFEMRDGQRFFADGRSDAKFQLLQQYMRLAGNWRIDLRTNVLKELSRWGKMPVSNRHRNYLGGMEQLYSGAGAGDYGFNRRWYGEDEEELSDGFRISNYDIDGDSREAMPGLENSLSSLADNVWWSDGGISPHASRNGQAEYTGLYEGLDGLTSFREERGYARGGRGTNGATSYFLRGRYQVGQNYAWSRDGRTRIVGSTNWLRNFMPSLGGPREPSRADNDTWSPEAISISNRVLRTQWLHQLQKPISRVEIQENLNVITGKVESRGKTELLYDKNRWLLRRLSPIGGTGIEWCDNSTRGVSRVATGLGRKRKAEASDHLAHSFSWDGHVVYSLATTFGNYDVRIEKKDAKTSVLRLRQQANLESTVDIVIDTEKDIVLEIVHKTKGVESFHLAFSEPVEFGGKWWTTKKVSVDREGRVSQRVTRTLEVPADAEVTETWARHIEDRSKMVVFNYPDVSISAARNAFARGSDTLDHHLKMLSLYLSIQNTKKARVELEAIRRATGDKYGTRWLTAVAFRDMKRNELARNEVLVQLRQLKDVCSKLERKGPDFGTTVVDGVLVTTGDLLTRRGLIDREFRRNLFQEEQLSFVRSTKPLYDSLSDYLRGDLLYAREHIASLQRIGYQDRARMLQIAIAKRYPDDLNLQIQAARDWASLENTAKSSAILKAELAKRTRIEERRRIRDAWLDLVRAERDYKQVVALYEAWPKEEIATSRMHGFYLNALLRLDKDDVYWQRLSEWVDEVCTVEGKLSLHQSSKAYNVGQELLASRIRYADRGLDDETLELLSKLVRRFGRSELNHQYATQIIQSNGFSYTKSAAILRKEYAEQIEDEVDTMDATTLKRLLHWCLADSNTVKLGYWKTITPKLMSRWDATKGVDRRKMGEVVWVALNGRADRKDQLDFLRKRLETSIEIHRRAAHQQLFGQLQSESWSIEVEQELFDLLAAYAELGNLEGDSDTLFSYFQNLSRHIFSSRLNHLRAKITQIKDLTKTERAEKQKEALSQAQSQFADVLARESLRQHKLLKPWIRLEEAYYRALESEYDKAAELSWSLLDSADDPVLKGSRKTLEYRCIAVLCRIATLDSTAEKHKTRFAKLLDKEIAEAGKNLREANNETENESKEKLVEQRERWRSWKYHLLVALDEPQVLVEQLAQWTRADDVVVQNTWRISLGHIRAEQGRIADGIKLFELAESETDLSGSELRTLAKWHLIVNAREAYEQIQKQSYEAMSRNALQLYVDRQRRGWGNTPPPSLDEEMIWAMQSMFTKDNGSYFRSFKSLYDSTKDFRLPASTADSMIGQSAPDVYRGVRQLQQSLTSINEEAAVDAMVKRSAEVRADAETAVDRRALDLFDLLAARRAAEIDDQPGEHIQRAAAAFKNAFKHKWDTGELQMYSAFLSSLSTIKQKELADIQLSQFKQLHTLSKPESRERLLVVQYWALALWNYGRRDEAIELQRMGLQEFMEGHDGQLTHNLASQATTLANWYEAEDHFRESETFLREMIEVHESPVMKRLFDQRLYACYTRALREKSSVSLGSGIVLYTSLEKMLREEVRNSVSLRRKFVEHLCSAYRSAVGLGFGRAKSDLINFADEFFELTKTYTPDTQYSVRAIGSKLDSLISHKASVEFLIESMEREPFSLRRFDEHGWRYLGDYLARYRFDAKNQMDKKLEDRVLKIVVRELRYQLEIGNFRNSAMYNDNHTYFWVEKKSEFAAVAIEVFKTNKDHLKVRLRMADFLRRDLGARQQSTQLLLTMLGQSQLDMNGKSKLTSFLHADGRFADSIELLESMMKEQPSYIGPRQQLTYAYYRTNQNKKAVDLLMKSVKQIKSMDGEWTVRNISSLADAAFKIEHHKVVVELHRELIALRTTDHTPGQYVEDQTLVGYFTTLSQSYSSLRQHDKAIDTACSAILHVGTDQERLQKSLDNLIDVLANVSDLTKFVTRLDADEEETGVINPFVRKALGKVQVDRGNWEAALVHLRIAVDLRPRDGELHELIIKCFDKLKDPAAALQQLVAWIETDRRSVDKYEQLAKRLDGETAKERAYTSMVEMLPNETDGHSRLATVRESQKDWGAAIEHWKRVSEIRSLEPTGLLQLANAQIKAGKKREAKESVKQLESKQWPDRFENLPEKIQALRKRAGG
jgi:hypothetical protein